MSRAQPTPPVRIQQREHASVMDRDVSTTREPTVSSTAPAVDLDGAVAQLDRIERVALDLSYRAGLTQRQIAVQLGVSERVVRTAIARALQDIARLMSLDGLAPA